MVKLFSTTLMAIWIGLLATILQAEETAEPELETFNELPSAAFHSDPWLSPDGLTLYFVSYPPNDKQGSVWSGRRKDRDSLFEDFQRLVPGDGPTVTGDGLEMILHEAGVLFATKRKMIDEPFGRPRKIPELEAAGILFAPCLSADGLTLYADRWPKGTTDFSGDNDLVRFERKTRSSRWGPAQVVNILPANVKGKLRFLSVSNDKLRAFAMLRRGDVSKNQVFVLSRTTIDEAFTAISLVSIKGDSSFASFPRWVEATGELFCMKADASKKLQIVVIRNFDFDTATAPLNWNESGNRSATQPPQQTLNQANRDRTEKRNQNSQSSQATENVYGLTGQVRGVHDPCIIEENGWYYVFSTGDSRNIPTWRSKDLRHWEFYGNVFDTVPKWVKELVPPAGKSAIMGPDIVFWKGRYYLTYSVAVTRPPYQPPGRIGLATNTTLDRTAPGYRWEDHGTIYVNQPTDNVGATDQQIFLKGGKEPWLVFGSTSVGKLRLIKLGNDMKIPAGSQFLQIAGRSGAVIEGPFLIERSGWYYLFVSFDKCCQGVKSTYNIRVGRSKQIEGPYVDFANRPMLEGAGTVVLAGHGTVRGPGHNAVLRVKDQDYLVHHFYDAKADGAQTLQIRPLLWGKDGWPLAGEPGLLAEDKKPGELPAAAGRWFHSVNFGEESELSLLKGGKINGADANTSWSQRDTNLTFRWPDRNAPRGAWTDECILSPDGKWYVGRNQQGAVIRGRRIAAR